MTRGITLCEEQSGHVAQDELEESETRGRESSKDFCEIGQVRCKYGLNYR